MLGRRPLELDGVEPAIFIDAVGATSVLKGTVPIRSATRADRATYPVLETWGLDVMRLAAEDLAANRRR